MRYTKSYSITTPSTTTPLSLQNTPIAVAIINNSSGSSLPQPPARHTNANVLAPSAISATVILCQLCQLGGNQGGRAQHMRTTPANRAEAAPASSKGIFCGSRLALTAVL